MTTRKSYTVLHITPHLGGGVGRVLLNYLEKVKENPDFNHKVFSLEYANERAVKSSESAGFFLKDRMSDKTNDLILAIGDADIVIIHWWNHPLLNAFLVREELPPARVAFWSHISGFHAPFVFCRPALNYPDLFVFTSPLSFETAEVKQLGEERKKALRVIWSTGGIDHVKSVQPRIHDGFKVGYIGTVDYCKMYPGFLKMNSRIKIPDLEFIVCGGPSDKQIKRESLLFSIKQRYVFTGPVNDITPYLMQFDVFGYPLAPYHYGTCEQSLCESMAAGIPPVVLANATERYIVEDGINGIVARDEEAYAKGIEELHDKPELRKRFAFNAKETARQRFSMEQMIIQWEKLFEEILAFPRTKKRWTGHFGGRNASASEIFLESLGDYGNDFFNSMNAKNAIQRDAANARIKRLYQTSLLWRSETHGTPKHYRSFFPESDALKLWSDLISIG